MSTSALSVVNPKTDSASNRSTVLGDESQEKINAKVEGEAIDERQRSLEHLGSRERLEGEDLYPGKEEQESDPFLVEFSENDPENPKVSCHIAFVGRTEQVF